MLEDGTPVGQLVASLYLLNEEGIPVSPGMVRLYPLEEGGGYIGFVGSNYFYLDKNGWPQITLEPRSRDGKMTLEELQEWLYPHSPGK